MRVAFFLFYVVLFVSCGTEKKEQPKKVQKSEIGVERPMTISSEESAFDDEVIALQKFSNGDVILYAQSKQEWVKAVNDELPAWCYVDTVQKLGVLYNGFCLIDQRGLGNKLNLMDEIQGAIFSQKKLIHTSSVQEARIYTTERNYLGNFYNIGFHNIWLKQTGLDVSKGYLLSYSPVREMVQLRKAHLGNGYFIRTLKTN